MDFGTLLHVAKRNSEDLSKNSGKYYSTKFSAPKKESKDKKLSDNIKKFLAKKENEEREKARIEKRKRDELLAMRDEKAKNKIKKMLKVIKSANKSVLEDAVDEDNTAVTIQGPDQPDEDDYGYVSQESSAFYQKYMDRVKTMPEENKFAPSRPASLTDLAGTKDRVKAAILREQEEANSGKRTKSSSATSSSATSSSSTSSSSKTHESSSKSSESHNSISSHSHRRKDLYDPQIEREMEEQKRREEAKKKAKSRPPLPPPMDFQQLLKLAEKKQHEPVEIVVEEKKEPERLLTKKEKREIEEQERRRKEKLKAESSSSGTPPVNKMQPNGRIPKLNGSSSAPPSNSEKSAKVPMKPPQTASKSVSDDKFKKPAIPALSSKVDSSKSRPESKASPASGLKPKSLAQSSSSSARPNDSLKPSTLKSSSSKPPAKSSSALPSSSQSSKAEPKRPYNGPTREFPPKDPYTAKKSQLQNGRSDNKPNGVSRDVQKTREFPPPDVRRKPEPPDVRRRPEPPDARRRPEPPRKPQPVKRRIYDDYDDEDEYDSELDDFIDDGPEEGENYSSYIKEIFGYDRSRYRDLDEDVDMMESSFAQQMREEYVSKKIGLLEDLEDMRKEEEEKKRKALMKKRKLK